MFQSHQLIFADGPEELVSLKADAYFDLLFETELYQEFENRISAGYEKKEGTGAWGKNSGITGETEESEKDSGKREGNPGILPAFRDAINKRAASLARLLPSPVFINSVIQPLSGIHPDFIRINGWPGFLEMPLLEAAAGERSGSRAREIFGEQIKIVKDVPGFVNPRIISMIINEAYFTLVAGVSTRTEIDDAMKLGTGYPLGPFEWGEKIGISRVLALLTALKEEDGLYDLAPEMSVPPLLLSAKASAKADRFGGQARQPTFASLRRARPSPPLLLLIDSSAPTAFVALSRKGRILFTEENPQPKEHSSWLHPAIKRILDLAGMEMKQLDAVAVSAGPGSYTGLRVGMAAAKGICYALKIPLITVNTLQLMAEAMVPAAKEKNALICPMIDARRQEIFTAVYSSEMKELRAPQALILDKTSFDEFLKGNKMIFSGSGSEKWKILTSSINAVFANQMNVHESFAILSTRYFAEKKWTELIHSEPIYLKEFYTHAKI